jgi:hypothetical protein
MLQLLELYGRNDCTGSCMESVIVGPGRLTPDEVHDWYRIGIPRGLRRCRHRLVQKLDGGERRRDGEGDDGSKDV